MAKIANYTNPSVYKTHYNMENTLYGHLSTLHVDISYRANTTTVLVTQLHTILYVAGLVPPPQPPSGKCNLIVINRNELKAKKYAKYLLLSYPITSHH